MRQEVEGDETEEKIGRVEEIYKKALEIVPHEEFTISKLWVMYAEFQVRCLDLGKARKILGQAIGKCPTHKIFREYCKLELNMGHLDRCRKIYEKSIEVFGARGHCWPYCEYAQFEANLGEEERARGIFEIGLKASMEVKSDDTDPEEVWKKYIQFEIDHQDFARARDIYERLIIQSNGHLKVWISFAIFCMDHEHSMENARNVFNRGNLHLKNQAKVLAANTDIPELEKEEQTRELTESRAMLLEKWLSVEKTKGKD